jgi:hypothetical protein
MDAILQSDGKTDTRLRPADGRVLLMFTDSRQGTARLSAKLQRDAEQNHIRAFIYHMLQASRGAADPEEHKRLEETVSSLRQVASNDAGIRLVLGDYERKLAELDQPKAIGWSKMVDSISQDDRINRFIREQVWVEREPEFSRRMRSLPETRSDYGHS